MTWNEVPSDCGLLRVLEPFAHFLGATFGGVL